MFSIKYVVQVVSIHKQHDMMIMMYEGCHHLYDAGVLNLPVVTNNYD